MTGKIFESELNAEVSRLMRELAQTPSTEGYTTSELSARMGCGEDKTRAMIRDALARGLMRVEKRTRLNMLGQVQLRPVYVLVEQKKAKK